MDLKFLICQRKEKKDTLEWLHFLNPQQVVLVLSHMQVLMVCVESHAQHTETEMPQINYNYYQTFLKYKIGVGRDHFFAPEIPSCENRTETGIPKILGH